jgi:hypothetical protein
MEVKPMAWSIKGEMIVNCNCAVFCPCVVSLGRHPPTEGYCQAWFGFRIDKGKAAGADLSGLNAGLLVDIPGLMSRGNYTLAGFIDERASEPAYDGLVEILSGRAGGSTSLFSLLVSNILGFQRAPIDYLNDGGKRRLQVGTEIMGEVEPITGNDPSKPVMIRNSEYWPGPDITVARANKGRVRAFGRVWNFGGLSAEIMPINWKG